MGTYDRTTSGARAVHRSLAEQLTTLDTYATNPLWRVVDGLWTLTRFTTLGHCEFAPNPSCIGPVRPRLAHVIEEPCPSDTAEFDALRSGQLTYGYLPDVDISQAGYRGALGSRVVYWIAWEISYSSSQVAAVGVPCDKKTGNGCSWALTRPGDWY